MTDNVKHKDKIFAYVVMGIYLLILCWIILFKLADSIERIPSIRAINLIPLYYDQISGSLFHIREVLDNVLIFIPAGFYFAAFNKRKAVLGIVLCALLSLGFEVTQWIFALGASDITDLITNTVGGTLGVILYLILRKIFKGKEVKIVSVIGALKFFYGVYFGIIYRKQIDVELYETRLLADVIELDTTNRVNTYLYKVHMHLCCGKEACK